MGVGTEQEQSQMDGCKGNVSKGPPIPGELALCCIEVSSEINALEKETWKEAG